jgi:hypothetical protein
MPPLEEYAEPTEKSPLTSRNEREATAGLSKGVFVSIVSSDPYSGPFDDIGTLDKACQRLFHKLGLGEAKHKTYIEVYNVYRIGEESFGNPETPSGIQTLEGETTTRED